MLSRRPEARTGSDPAGWAASALPASLGTSTFHEATRPVTFQEEYAFFVSHLGELPAGCALAVHLPEADIGFVPSESYAALRGLQVPQVRLHDVPSDPPTCVVFYRGGTCTSLSREHPGQTACEAFEARVRLEEIATAEVVSRGWLWESHGDAPVPLGFFRVRAR